MSGIYTNIPSGRELALCNVLPQLGSSPASKPEAHRAASTNPFSRWRAVLLMLLFSVLPAAMFGATAATLSSPAAGSTLAGSSVTFSWTAGSGVQAYSLWVGSTGVNTKDIFQSGVISATSITVPNLPTNGETLYVAVYSEINGAWTPINYTFTAAGSSAVPATLASPAAGSVLTGSSVTFSWTAGSQVQAYSLWIGSTGVNTKDIFQSGAISATSITVPGLPTNGETLYVAVYSKINGNWTAINYTVKASSGSSVVPAALSSPAAGSTLTGSSVTFSWTAGTNVPGYALWIGSTGVNTRDIFDSGVITATSITVPNLPTNGETLYVAVYSEINGAWTPINYTVKAAGSSAAATLSAVSCSSSSLTGSGTDSCTVTLSGAAPSAGQSVTLASSSSAVTVPSTVTVAAGATSATFTATAKSVSTAQAVTLTATSGSVSKTVSLELNAATVVLGINATSVSFGDVAVNTASTQSLTLTATGTAPVTVSAATVTGTGFSITGATLPMTLNPGQTAELNVQFDPAVTGAVTGQLNVSSNSTTGSTAAIALSGTGSAYDVALTWQAPASSSDRVAGYNVYRALSGSTAYELVNSSVQTATSYTDNTVQAGETYDYVIESVDASGNESAPSAVAVAVIP